MPPARDLFAARDNDTQQSIVEGGDDQQDRVRAGGSGLEQLVLVDEKILAEQRHRHRLADRNQVVERAVKKSGLGQH